MKKIDIAVIGGGASGMTAAISAARRAGCSVCLIEAQQRVGRKLLSTGNGRCNLSNTDISDSHYRSADISFVRIVLDRVPTQRVSDFICSLGLQTIEESGRIYPHSEQAASVLDMLRSELTHLGVDVICGSRVRRITKQKDGFIIEAGEERMIARRVILACGSSAAPQLGGCDDGIRLALSLGHSRTVRPMAALAPVEVKSDLLSLLKGVRVKCSLSLLADGKLIHRERGELQFNESSLSGIVVFQMSSRIARLQNEDIVLSIDILPDCDRDDICADLCRRRVDLGHLSCEDFLVGMFNRRISIALMRLVGVKPITRQANTLSNDEITSLADNIKDWRFCVSGVCGFKQAQVMSGGIRLGDVDEDMQSKRCRGAYLCGEMLDCDGDCGGYNLHWAWITGILAGESAAASLRDKEKISDDIEQY